MTDHVQKGKEKKSIIPILLIAMVMIITAIQAYKELYTPKVKISQIHWLLGTWKIDEGSTYEKWEQINDTLLLGTSFRKDERDTFNTQKLRIVKRGEDMFFIPDEIKDDKMNPKEYKLVSKEPLKLYFDNIKFGFPQTIEYRLKKGKLRVRWMGWEEGPKHKKKEFTFYFNKVK